MKIADFGLAKLLGQTTADRGLTASQQVMGTWHYMAPEQIEHPLQVDQRADIYSLGVVFYELLTGGLPLGHFALPSQRAPVDAQTDAVILKALAKEPEHRYQHVHEMKEAILPLDRGFQASPRLVDDAKPAGGAALQTASNLLGSPAFLNLGSQEDERTQRLRHRLLIPTYLLLIRPCARSLHSCGPAFRWRELTAIATSWVAVLADCNPR